ncbi:protein-glutamate O-methyltransferase CheR [Acidocella sp.]|uniref:CheR family methyltransferase n=1 Tax=Acidocella sp. TaxID=50710 RepID=UPI0026122DBE|nr:protein-glutamate O-methyltransferase CheR [Acidocella sp.]
MSQTPRAHSLVGNAEFAFTARDLEVITEIMRRETGVSLTGAKANLVYSRLAKRLRKLGLESFGQYCQLIQSHEGEAERMEMLAALTTNVTRFFREPHHFEHLRDKMLPGMARYAQSGGRVRLWSAACSSGQEPYSMALTLLEAMPDAARLDVRILATDIDPNMLREGEDGIYEDGLLEGVPPAMRRAHFTRQPDGRWRVSEEVRRLVRFRRLNLIGHWPMKAKFQAVFCRNVVIYFDGQTQETIWSRFVPLLDDGGALYIGHSERVTGPAEPQFQNDGITIYRKLGAGGKA